MPLLQQLIDSAHFAELIAEEQIEPRGAYRDDLRAGIVASTVANCNRTAGKPAFKASQFIPRFQPVERQSVEQMKANVQAWNAALGGEERQRGNDPHICDKANTGDK